MLQRTPPGWAHVLPGYGGFRTLTSAILTPGFTQTGPLLIAVDVTVIGMPVMTMFIVRSWQS